MNRKKTFLSLVFILAISFQSFAQYQKNVAIGLRIGEPLGLNIRKYFQSGDKAFDVNFGTYGFLYGTEVNYRKGKYYKSGLMLQGIHQWHFTISKDNKLKSYLGFGGQVNYREYLSDEDLIGNRSVGEKLVSFGPTGNIGMEYNLPGNDIGVFLDAGAYVELIPDFLFFHPQFSTGIRVNIVSNKN